MNIFGPQLTTDFSASKITAHTADFWGELKTETCISLFVPLLASLILKPLSNNQIAKCTSLKGNDKPFKHCLPNGDTASTNHTKQQTHNLEKKKTMEPLFKSSEMIFSV